MSTICNKYVSISRDRLRSILLKMVMVLAMGPMIAGEPINMIEVETLPSVGEDGVLLIPLRGKNVLAWEIEYDGLVHGLDGEEPFFELVSEADVAQVTVTAIGMNASSEVVRDSVVLRPKYHDPCNYPRQYPDTTEQPVVPGTTVLLRMRILDLPGQPTIDGNPMRIWYQSGHYNLEYDYIAVEDTTVTARMKGQQGLIECYWPIRVVPEPILAITNLDHEPSTDPPNSLASPGTLHTIRLVSSPLAARAEVNGAPMIPRARTETGDIVWELTREHLAQTLYYGRVYNLNGDYKESQTFVRVEETPIQYQTRRLPAMGPYWPGSPVRLILETNAVSADIDGVPMTRYEGGDWIGFTAEHLVDGDTTVEAVLSDDEGNQLGARWEIDCGRATLAGVDQTVCGSARLSALPVSGASWQEIDGDGKGMFSEKGDPMALFTGTPGVTYMLSWGQQADPCGANGKVNIHFLDPGFTLDRNEIPGIDALDLESLSGLWADPMVYGAYDFERIGRVNILTLIRVRACFR